MKSKEIKFSIIYCCLVYTLSTSASAQQTNAFSAPQAVEYALKNSAQVKNSHLDTEI